MVIIARSLTQQRKKEAETRVFRPHELLEAALASCFNITLQRFAKKRGLSIEQVVTRVSVDHSLPDETIIKYSIDIQGPVSDTERKKLIKAARSCPVHQTLSKKLTFRQEDLLGVSKKLKPETGI